MLSQQGGSNVIELRLVRPEERAEAAELADMVFQRQGQPSMGDAFPMIFSSALGQSFGAFDQGKLVSFIGLVPAGLRTGASALNVYSMGCVCTHPEHQGKGYASQLLNQVLAHADRSGASLLLVSGGRSLYERAHCYPFGAVEHFTLHAHQVPARLAPTDGQTWTGSDVSPDGRTPSHVRVPLDGPTSTGSQATSDRHTLSADRATLDEGTSPNRSALPDGLIIRKNKASDWFSLQRLASERICRYEQSIWDLALLIEAEALASCYHMQHEVYVAERSGRMLAFAVVAVPGENSRQQAMVLEWAGQADAMYALLCGVIRELALPELTITVSWHEKDLRKQLIEAGLNGKPDRNGGTAKIVNGPRLLEQLHPYLVEKNAELQSRLNIEWRADGGCRVSIDEQFVELDPKEFASLLFDPDPAITMETELKQALSGLFPIPLPYTRGLNYV